jgi:hypothetical protein
VMTFSGTPNAAGTSLVGTCTLISGSAACSTTGTPWTMTRP